MPVLDNVIRKRPSVFATVLIVSATYAGLASVTRAYAQEGAPAAERIALSPHTLRPTIAVLSVNDLDEAGKAHAIKSQNRQGDAVALALAEEAITRSHAYNVYARDLMASQAKEIKLDSEGFVTASSAKKFGKGVGIEKFLQVFISNPSTRHFTGQNVSEYVISTSGEPVLGPVFVQPVGDSSSPGGTGLFGMKKKPVAPGPKRELMQSNVGILCRFTQVESGKTETVRYAGVATADAYHCDIHRLIAAATQNAFDNFRSDLSKNRRMMLANVVKVEKGMAIVDMGEDDGLVKDMAFEVCEVETVGGFDTYTRVCDARVESVHAKGALLELGDYKKELFKKEPSFHPNENKAKLVHKGCVIQEKKF